MALSVSIRTAQEESIDIELSEDKNKLFVLGANGTGKSALLHNIHQQHSERAHRVAAYRHTYFESNNFDLSGSRYKSATEEFRNWDFHAESRYTEPSGGLRAIRSIAALMQSQRERDRRATALLDEGENDQAGKYVRDNRDPFDIINGMFEASNLGVRVSIMPDDLDTIVAQHIAMGKTYTVERLSDGERSALLLAAEILTADEGTLFLLDEPERHLHRSIISPLLSELFAARADCYFVISTHEVLLPEDCGPASVLILRGCDFFAYDMAVIWNVDVVEPEVELDDDIKVDIWGARRKLLYVEGRPLGPDERLYSALFPEATVKAKGSCEDVIKSVENARSSADLHWLEVYGMIDGDTRSPDAIDELRGKGVFVLPVREVESLYYGSEIRDTLVRQQAKHLGKSHGEMSRRAQEAVLGNTDTLKPLTPEEESDLAELSEARDSDGIVNRFPIGKSKIPTAIATALDYPDKKRYERAACALVKSDEAVRDRLISACGDIAASLLSEDDTPAGSEDGVCCS